MITVKGEKKAELQKQVYQMRSKELGRLLRHIPVIKGEAINVSYKIQRQGKFVNNCDTINNLLQKVVNSQLKKDSNNHGTYSLNPFAMYPKNIKNTVANLFLNKQNQNLIPNDKKYELAFIDQV